MRQREYLAGHLVSSLPKGKWYELWNMNSTADIRSRILIERPDKPDREWTYETIRSAMKMLVDLDLAQHSTATGKHLWSIRK